jgi:hypothetical protein
MVYTGEKLHFFVDGQQEQHAANDQGPLLRNKNPLFIGQAGTGTSKEYFTGRCSTAQAIPGLP